jgi:hypothetical protein
MMNDPLVEMPSIAEKRFRGLFCCDPAWDEHRAPDLAHHVSTAYVLAELKIDREAADARTPDTTVHPGIAYETSGD